MAKLNSTIVQGSLRVTDEINASAVKVNGTNVLTSHQSVSSSNNTASFGSAVVVGNVGGTDLKFTMPANPNSNTWRKIQLNGTDKLGTGTGTNPLNIKAGSNMTITESSGTFTFAATDTTYSNASQSAAGLMSSTDKTRVDNMWSALNGTDSTKIDTIAEVYAFLEDYAQTTDLATQLGTKVTANSAITGAQKCKITYDSKGLVTGGADLAASDIPNLGAGKITSGTFDIARIPTGTTGTTVALGNHTHSYLPLSGGTITASGSSDNALNLKSATSNSYLKFSNSSGTVLGYLGVNSSKKPVFYDTAAHQLAYTSDIPTTLPASDVSAWAKAATKPSYTLDEVTDGSTRKLSNYVPFAGATSDVDLGTAQKLSVGFLDIYATSTSTSTSPYSNYIAFRESKTANDLTGIRLYADGTDLIVKNVDSSGNLVTRETIATQEYISALGYTSNTGTVTGIKVGSSGSTLSPSSGVITIPAYPTKSSWNYDDTYLKLSGGTLSMAYGNGNTTTIKMDLNGIDVNTLGYGIRSYASGSTYGVIAVQGWDWIGFTGQDGGVQLSKGNYGSDANKQSFISSTQYNYSFPNKNGTVALTSDIPSAVTETTVSGWGFTKNGGTVTGIKVGSSGSTLSPSSGIVTIPAYPTKSSWNYDDKYVPFSGAASNVDLGAAIKLSAGFLDIYTSSNSISNYIAFRESTTASDLTGIRLSADGTDLIIKNVNSSGNLVTRETIATQEYVTGLGYTSNSGTVTSVRVQAGTGLSSSTSTAQSSSLNTTISIASGYKLPTTTEWNGKQNALTAQTAYSAKGSATKVPQITTNSLGQVTSISEVTITNTKTYKHDIILTNSASASSNASYKICFTLYSNQSTALTITGAMQLLFSKPPAAASANKLAAWARTANPIYVVVTEWSRAYFYPRTILTDSLTYSGNNLTKFTLRPMEGAMDFDGYNMRISLFTSDLEFTVSNLTISDTVVEC